MHAVIFDEIGIEDNVKPATFQVTNIGWSFHARVCLCVLSVCLCAYIVWTVNVSVRECVCVCRVPCLLCVRVTRVLCSTRIIASDLHISFFFFIFLLLLYHRVVVWVDLSARVF